ncbi:Uncharacterised protein g9435 [Pycnogonum litorale]
MLQTGRAVVCPPETPSVCECRDKSGELHFICNSNDFDAIKQDFSALSRQNASVDYVYVESDMAKSLGPSFFGNASVFKAHLRLSNLMNVNPDVFKGQEDTMYEVGFYEVKLKKLPLQTWAKLTHLKSVSYSGMSVTEIDENAFCALVCPNELQGVYFESMLNLQKVGEGSFSALRNLKKLFLTGSKLSSLPANSLPRDTLLSISLIGGNKFTKVPDDALDALVTGGTLFMDNTQVQNFTEKQLELVKTKSLKLYLDGCPIYCGCEFKRFVPTGDTRTGVNGRCAGPPRLRDFYIFDLAKSNFAECPE